MAKGLLAREGIEYEERNIESGDWSRAQMLEAVPDAKTVPQIFFGEEHVGGFTELQEHLRSSR
jgi:glutaredoxin 3